MLVPILLFIVGLVLLIKGGDWFVDGATGLAHRFHVPEILIGATVVSIGTTLPEVMVSATSAVSGHGEIAYGNAIGSVICNTALIAALTIAIRPSEADRKSLRTPVIFFFVAAAFYAAIAYTSGAFTRLAGIVLLAMFVLYMVLTVRQSFRDTVRAGGADEAIDGTPSMGKDILLLVVGAAFIAVGANLLVNNGTLIAQGLGVPESVIALTFVALGRPCRSWSPPSPPWSRATVPCPWATSWGQTCLTWCWSAACPPPCPPSRCPRKKPSPDTMLPWWWISP